MAPYAELELSLHRRESGYALELRYSQPDSDADVRLMRDDSAPVRFEAQRLRELANDPQAYGAYLGERLLADPAARDAFARARASAQALDAPLRLRLFIAANAPELHHLRWETLRDPCDGASLVTGERVLFSRYLSSADWRPVKLRPQSALRALAVVANPADLPRFGLSPIDVIGELRRAKAALDRVALSALAGPGRATLNGLIARLRDGCDILYLVCHGSLVEGEPYLWLEREDGASARVPLILAEMGRKSASSADESTGRRGAAAVLRPPLSAPAGSPSRTACRGSPGR